MRDAPEDFFQRLFEAAPGLYVVVTPDDYRILSVTDSFLRATGTTREQLVGRLLFDLIPEDTSQPFAGALLSVRESLERVKRTRAPDTMAPYRLPAPLPDGTFETRAFSAVNQPVSGADGSLAYLIHAVEDITGQEAARAALARTEQLLQIASQTARIGGWLYRRGHDRVEWSEEVCTLHDAPPGTNPTVEEGIRFYAPEWRDSIGRAFWNCFEHGTAFDMEAQLLTTRGRRVWIRTIATPVRDARGDIIQVQGAIQDISVRKEAELSLLDGELRLRQLADAMPQIVWTANTRGDVDFANQAFFRYMTGAPRPGDFTPVLQHWLEAVHADDLARASEAWSTASAQAVPYSIEFRLRGGADGEYRWFLISASPIRDSSDQVVKWYGTGTDIHDRKVAEEAAQRLAERLNATLESIGDGLYTLDRDWRFTYFNRRAEEMLRLEPGQLLGADFWKMLPEPYDPTVEHSFQRAAELREVSHYESYFEPTQSWFDVSVYPSDDGLSVYFRDITEQHRIRQELEEGESRFRAIARATVDVIWDWDRRTNRIWWNDGLQSVFGYPRDQVGETLDFWSERVHPDDRDAIARSFNDSIEQRAERWKGEYRFRHRDGSYRDVEDRGFLILDADGEPVRLVGGISDITERKRLQVTLRRQAALLDEAAEAILVRGPKHDIQYWNRGAERLYGWTADEARGQAIENLLYDDPAAFLSATAIVKAHGEWNGQLTQKRKDGTYLIVECHWTLLHDELSEPGSILAINADITERRALEEQLRQSQRLEAVGQLTGGVAHDFNNLLTVILGSSELFIEQLGDNERLRSLAEMTRAAAHRGAELTQRLLAFARRQALDPAPTNINRLLSGMDPLLRRTLPANVEIELVQGGGLWNALVDSAQLESAVLNLCLNARDAMLDGGRMTIETANSYLDFDYADRHTEVNAGRYVLVAITDTGAGMADDVLERAFDPFFTTKPVGQGTGLGLSMVYGFIKQSGGHVKIYSEIGQGTTVKLYLPRALQDDVQPGRYEQEIPEQGGSETILVVEDDDLVRDHVEDQLRSLGYRVLTAPTGDAGLDVLRKHEEIDLLFTDVVMPGTLNGRKLADAARALRPDLKILFTSGYTENAIVHQGRLDPGIQLLSKPYRRAALARKVRQVLNQD